MDGELNSAPWLRKPIIDLSPSAATIEIVPIPQIQLHAHWDFVLRGLKEISADSPQDWIPEDVFTGIKAQGAELFLFKRGEKHLGFFIGYPMLRQFSGIKQYFIWILWSIGLKERDSEDDTPVNKNKVFDFIVSRAKELDCVHDGKIQLTLLSKRKGFERILGFKLHQTEYRLEIPLDSNSHDL